ncbi:TetR family transcriptional regulator [Sinomonas cellulolyticus]|uniref:TetR/AcrR family transcriptional regulator n=1 Tax=Sinomonas cellulolyticus TaxID=2801916 RepID=A0ABS1K3T0_9MICC|nr:MULTISPECIES: TetR/AcrR family transcriptional regulator [Sinomonas]MBL0706148.1 TetR/AcrR family transcriptional regulator [Sinomonas cellulolyticus]GHG55206.1 TetR family transcriptional regulator [Sinomonas sp. KCTC 49339]
MNGREIGRAATEPSPSAREKILKTAYGLFAKRGVRDVGIDEIISRSGVAKATFYRHFRSKDALVLAYMDRWYAVRSEAIEDAIAHSHSPDDALLAAFTVLDEWFRRGAAEVNTFLKVLIEFGGDHPLGRAAMDHLAAIRGRLAALAEAAGLDDPEGFAWSFHILTKGAMVASIEGDLGAAARARSIARALIALHRPDRPEFPLRRRAGVSVMS